MDKVLKKNSNCFRVKSEKLKKKRDKGRMNGEKGEEDEISW